MPVPAASDEKLIQQAQRGDLDAFGQLYHRYLPLVHRRVRYIVPEQDVDDVTQEVFIAVLHSLPGFRGEARFSTWLRTLTNRKVADFYRHQGRKSVPPTVPMPEGTSGILREPSVSYADRNEERLMLRRALQSLSEAYREVLLLRFAEGLQFQEIADLQGLSLEATKSLFRRAVSSLREKMTE